MGAVSMRAGRTDDVEAAVAIYRTSNDARRSGRATLPSHVERVRQKMAIPDARLFLAEDGGVGVGMALTLQGRAEGGGGAPIPRLCFISMIFVVPDRWGEGIGGSLVTTVIANSRQRGFTSTQL